MNISNPSLEKKQTGMILLEALIAILIFSMGILAIVGLQTASIKMSSDAEYRTQASLLANQLIGMMWVGDRTPDTLIANFSSPGGALYTSWLSSVSTLPGAADKKPTVTITKVAPVAPATSVTSLVTITIYWKAPSEPATNPAHQYTSIAQII